MGKGARNRAKTTKRQEAYDELRLKSRKAASRAKGFALAAAVLTVLAAAFQFLLQGVMRANLNSGAYEALHTDDAEIASLRSILPVGTIGLVLLILGTALTAVFVMRCQPKLSLTGGGLSVVGAAFFIPYVHTLGQLFTFDALAGVDGRGLDFWALIWQHYATLFPLLLLIPAVWLCFVSVKKAEVADIMHHAQDTVSTLSLDAED